jgi:sterol desaturase/sphingolipid hydroxylase (fatty acid hydroxylase superfamily)
MAPRHISELLLHSASLRGVASGFLRALAIGVVFYFLVYLLERASGGTTTQYHTPGFIHDVAYWFYYRSGLDQLLFMAVLFSFLSTKVAFLHLNLLGGLHPILRGALWILVGDFTSYWVHRLQHASRFLWAFHSTHHAQEQLNFATTTRFHPVDHFISNTLTFFPLLILGTSPMSWVPLYLASDFLAITQHSRIKWRLGALSRVLVTPWFHSFHHSTDPRHFQKNFGSGLSIWDRVFGTAVDAPEQPAEYGLTDVKMPTFMSTLSLPFRLLFQTYGPAWSSWYNTGKARLSSEPAGHPPSPYTLSPLLRRMLRRTGSEPRAPR